MCLGTSLFVPDALFRQIGPAILNLRVGASYGCSTKKLAEAFVPLVQAAQDRLDLETLVKQARSAGASPIIALATEAMREVANGPAFIELVSTTLFINAVLISGQEEAALDYCWATFPPVPPSPLLVVDSGGGSTQVILGEEPAPAFAHSLPVGAGNLTKQFVSHDPPTKEELAALSDHAATQVGMLPLVLTPQSAVLMGGSADHLLQFASAREQHTLTRDDLHRTLHALHHTPARETAHDYGCLEERARLLAAGAVILLQAPCTTPSTRQPSSPMAFAAVWW